VSVDHGDGGLARTVDGGIRHLGIGVHFVEVGLVAFRGCLDGFLAGVPVRRTDLEGS